MLEGFSLKINPGDVVAIAGSSGSGKSTVASLLIRLYDVESNSAVMVGGEVAAREDQCCCARAPVICRVGCGKYAIWKSICDGPRGARIAHVLDFSDKLSDGLDTPVGQRGTQLSGRQKKKVAIATTVLRDPPMVISNKAGAESESHVQEANNTVIKGQTVISVAHRLSRIAIGRQITR